MDCSPPGSSVHGDSPGKNPGVGCHALLQGIFPAQGLNPGLLHCRWILYHLSHQGSPHWFIHSEKRVTGSLKLWKEGNWWHGSLKMWIPGMLPKCEDISAYLRMIMVVEVLNHQMDRMPHAIDLSWPLPPAVLVACSMDSSIKLFWQQGWKLCLSLVIGSPPWGSFGSCQWEVDNLLITEVTDKPLIWYYVPGRSASYLRDYTETFSLWKR